MSMLDDLLALRNAATGEDWRALSPEERRERLALEYETEAPVRSSGRCPVTNKAIHENKEHALMEIRRAKMSKGVEAYICRACRGWHVGNPPPPKKRKIKVRR